MSDFTVRWRASASFREIVDPGTAPVIEIEIEAADAAEADEVLAELLEAFPGEPVGDGTDCLVEVVGPKGESRLVRVPS